MAKSMAKSAGKSSKKSSASAKSSSKKSAGKSASAKSSSKKSSASTEPVYRYFRERRATELILEGCECVDTFFSNALGTELYAFIDTPDLTEALRQIDLKKGVIHCNY